MRSRSPLLALLAPLTLLALSGCGDDPPPIADGGPPPDAEVVDQQTPDLDVDASVGDGATDSSSSDSSDATTPDASSDATAPDATAPDAIAPDGVPTDLFYSDGQTAGQLTVLSYNIAGLPFGMSQSDPYKNTPLISPLLNTYALVLMQEDFAFTTQLSSKALHPFKSTPGTAALGTFMNDGLTRFADYKFTGHTRIKWKDCNGVFDQANDCLASKGFSVGVTLLAPGVTVDVYNLHMDAGNASGDLTARAKQVDQLLAEIATRSAGQAIIVAGDTNIKPAKNTQNKTMLAKLLTQAKLTDACVHLSCGEADRIDRVMYRSSAALQLEAKTWKVDTTFVDSAGKDLSDHEAVGVLMSWKVLAPGGG
jgi:hypothetical protein